jgi:hypothetical protein
MSCTGMLTRAPSSHRALDNRVRIVNQEGNAHTRSPKRLRRLAGSTLARGELVTHEELVSVQSQLAAHELIAARLRHSVYFFGAKDTFVEVQGGGQFGQA